ncbi:MAG: UDP-N-acetylmuramyl peptide synthase [Spirochaetes bacterium GWD1_61_31]|nr:MAG: UDP-N-acetylmuramyl peptide synthase [Spirochaetes bacterium GWB1_60_80]OHD31520.1 MAG: UDP-N-acetylmuramyl peptide synthase [Spirochaetes bacterium GWC1_61_12]OHD43297.1 MAG: UDP-N-acetylmuramyl peptide synthase [Spirochaetes bacterium GWD1_61_31]OHD45613.1 MAG: UDP-N-acetylmuramyl peptide synthase [Spirochaetes bacterium GWE1_60_18]OHD60464.1 MAG: UDP-N-acetylmuramyl peptide synthase [Spirochaetes bacterium GWF1_60_12]HAP44735.1 UDP-N-acetylmuramoyl-L-alanyl-D-glutamate--2,6-diaminop
MNCPLCALLPAMPILEIHGDTKLSITGLAYDSRDIQPGFLFFALSGLHVDGHDYIDQAIAAGASTVVHCRALPSYRPGICYLRTDDSRFAMSAVAHQFWSRPSEHLTVIGVTGTEGKSTTVWLIARLLELCGARSGFISTVDYRVGDQVRSNPKHQTTPEATAIHEKLAAMVANGLEYAVVESSSHGLSPRTNRLGDVAFDVGVMTNVRHEHLEFHGSWEQYRHDKANLFRALDRALPSKLIAGRRVERPSFGVACADDPSAGYFAAATVRPVQRYSMQGSAADALATAIHDDQAGADFLLRLDGLELAARSNLPGQFNVENILAAVLVVYRLGLAPLATIVGHLPALTPVKGRMTRVECGQAFEVLVDYAHTPSSFETILPPLRRRVTGSLICVFGSGGERDTQKRPRQGEIASRYCDVVILADEDPRGEEPMAILEQIAVGCGGKSRGVDLFLIPDRAAAIAKAFALAKPDSTVLLLGKSHENTIDYETGAIAWDEISQAEQALHAITGTTG